MKSSSRPVVLLATLLLAGCGTTLDTALDTAGRRAGAGIGNAIGTRVGEQAGAALAARMPAIWTPDLTAIYMNYLFTMAFHSGSYTFEGTDYEPREWTRWRLVDSDSEGQPDEMERAFLNRRDDGKEWWRVKYIAEAEEGRDSITVEALFDPETGEFVRMRSKMPGEPEATEMPVEEGTYGYVEPRRLTAESLEGAVVGTETLRVPAGSYTAKHVRYGGMDAGRYDWWLTDDVPGGMVKYSRSYEEREAEGADPYNWTVELIASGRDARSELGVEY
ncbi:MAG: hypothetical protein ACOC3J_05825 [Gemmatimonadota bacterium]